jgi:quinol-cytochrome oxidoreductase complex cytochrome b subunit
MTTQDAPPGAPNKKQEELPVKPQGGKPPADRLLAVVRQEAIQRMQRVPDDKINVWPHLIAAEFVSLLIMSALLFVISGMGFADATFRTLADPNLTPNPSKAPWYFLGLQELLRYYHPQVAGQTILQWNILGLMALPFIDRNPSSKPQDRKLAIILFTLFIFYWATLVILGSFFRGPGFNFVFPWNDGIFFEL